MPMMYNQPTQMMNNAGQVVYVDPNNYYARSPQQVVSSNNYGMMQNQTRASGPTIYTRVVNTPEEITPQEVPTNGGVGIFPQADGTCIYTKTWMNNGMIMTDRYVLEQKNTQENGVPSNVNEFSQVMERLNKIEEMLIMINPDLKNLVNQESKEDK